MIQSYTTKVVYSYYSTEVCPLQIDNSLQTGAPILRIMATMHSFWEQISTIFHSRKGSE